MATVRIPSPLQHLTEGRDEVEVDGNTVQEVIDGLIAAHPALKERLLDEEGRFRRFINVYVNEEDIRFLEEFETSVGPNDVVSLVPAIAGGAPC